MVFSSPAFSLTPVSTSVANSGEPDRPWTAAPWRQGLAALAAASLGSALLKIQPALEVEFFAAGAARLASLFTGQPLIRLEKGWMLPDANLNIIVTAACSATDFFLMVAIVIAWQLAGRRWSAVYAALGGIAAAAPLAMILNSLRIVTVSQLHRWLGPHLPSSYGPILHLATGVAIFLPSLIALHGLLDFRSSPRSALSA